VDDCVLAVPAALCTHTVATEGGRQAGLRNKPAAQKDAVLDPYG
jgi:hypothetical protein